MARRCILISTKGSEIESRTQRRSLMKANVASLTGMIFFLTVGSVMAEKPLRDYSLIRGACYPGGWRNSQAIIERDLGDAKKLNLNSTRVWLGFFRRRCNSGTLAYCLNLTSLHTLGPFQ